MRLRLHLAATAVFLELSACAALFTPLVPVSGGGNWIGGIAVAMMLGAGALAAAVVGVIATNVLAGRRAPDSASELWRPAFSAGTWPLLAYTPLGFIDARLALCLVPPAIVGALLAWRPVAPRLVLALLPVGGPLAYVVYAAPDWMKDHEVTRASIERDAFHNGLRGVELTSSGGYERDADIQALVDVLASASYREQQKARVTMVEDGLVELLTDADGATSGDEIRNTVSTVQQRVDLVLASPATAPTPWVTFLRGIKDGVLPAFSATDPALFRKSESMTAAIVYAAERRNAPITRALADGLPEHAWHAAAVRLLDYGLDDGRWLLMTAGALGADGKVSPARIDRDFVTTVVQDLVYYEEQTLLGRIADLDTAFVGLMAFHTDRGTMLADHVVAEGAAINGMSACGASPLSALLSHNSRDAEALAWLIAQGADVNLPARGYCGADADEDEGALVAPPLWLLLDRARRKPTPECEPALATLLTHGADWKARDARGRSLLEQAKGVSSAFAAALASWAQANP